MMKPEESRIEHMNRSSVGGEEGSLNVEMARTSIHNSDKGGGFKGSSSANKKPKGSLFEDQSPPREQVDVLPNLNVKVSSILSCSQDAKCEDNSFKLKFIKV